MDDDSLLTQWCLEHGIPLEEGMKHRAVIEASLSYQTLALSAAINDLLRALLQAFEGSWVRGVIDNLLHIASNNRR